MGNERILIGQFIKRREQDPDDSEDLFAPGGVMPKENSFLETYIPNPDLKLSRPSEIPFQEAPPIVPTHPAGIQLIASPTPSRPPAGPLEIEDPPFSRPPSDPLDIGDMPESHPPAEPLEIDDPPETTPAGPQPAPVLSEPGELPPPPPFIPIPLSGESPIVGFSEVLTQESPPQPSQTTQDSRPPADPRVPSPEQGGPVPSVMHSDSQSVVDGGLSVVKKTHDSLDRDTGEFIRKGVDQPYSVSTGLPGDGQGALALDPGLYLAQLSRLKSLGPGRLAAFAAKQATLFAQNSRGRVWNPALVAPPPVAQNFILPALDLPGIGEPVRDIHLEMALGTYSVDRITIVPPFYESQKNVGSGQLGEGTFSGFINEIPGASKFFNSARMVGARSQDGSIVDDPTRVSGPLVQQALDERNLYSPDAPFSENATFTHREVTESALREGAEKTKGRLKSIFQAPRGPGTNAGEQRPNPTRQRSRVDGDSLTNSFFQNGIIPVRFKGENSRGFSTFQQGSSPKVKDDDAYVPLSFTDLRPIGNVFRTVYFRPFITALNESFSPEWNRNNFFARTDAVATYQSTGRTIGLSFRLVAFSPEDVRSIYDKLNWLVSMVYPEYDKDLIYASGPVLRMRVGDVINARGPEGSFGLPGIIQSLDFDYSEAIWELQPGLKVPRDVAVSLSFLVLHDRPIGRGEEGRFGAIGKFLNGRYVPPGSSDKSAGGDGHVKFAEVEGIDSFRFTGGRESNRLNEYNSLGSADEES